MLLVWACGDNMWFLTALQPQFVEFLQGVNERVLLSLCGSIWILYTSCWCTYFPNPNQPTEDMYLPNPACTFVTPSRAINPASHRHVAIIGDQKAHPVSGGVYKDLQWSPRGLV